MLIDSMGLVSKSLVACTPGLKVIPRAKPICGPNPKTSESPFTMVEVVRKDRTPLQQD